MAAGVPGITSRQEDIQRKKRGHLFLSFTLRIVINPSPEVSNPSPQWPAGSYACPNCATKEGDLTTRTELPWVGFTNESCGGRGRNLNKMKTRSVRTEAGSDLGWTSNSVCNKPKLHFSRPPPTLVRAIYQFQNVATARKYKLAGFYSILRCSRKVLPVVLRPWVLKSRQ